MSFPSTENASRQGPKPPLPAVAYLRVSTENQADTGVSLDAQRAKVEGYSKLYELDLIEVYEDAGASGKSLARPGLRAALDALGPGKAAALVVAKLDRLTRNVRDLGELLDRHFAAGQAALFSVGEQIDTRSPGGRLVLNVLVSVAQWEREAISERTRTALTHKMSRGERVGSVRFGQRLAADGKTLEPDPAEQSTIARARELHAEGLALAAVGRRLAAEGHLSRARSPLAASQVQRLLAR